MTVEDLISRHVRAVMRARREMIERACEHALVSGNSGVEVTDYDDGTTVVTVSPLVPYQEIHYRMEHT